MANFTTLPTEIQLMILRMLEFDHPSIRALICASPVHYAIYSSHHSKLLEYTFSRQWKPNEKAVLAFCWSTVLPTPRNTISPRTVDIVGMARVSETALFQLVWPLIDVEKLPIEAAGLLIGKSWFPSYFCSMKEGRETK